MKLFSFLIICFFLVQVYSNCTPSCKNGGTCALQNGIWGCKCTSNWIGNACQSTSLFYSFPEILILNFFFFQKIARNPCASNPCENGGTCIVNGDSFTCQCGGDFTGPRCQACMIFFFFFFFMDQF